MNVFIGGSRAVSKLNAAIRGRIDDLIARGCTILAGDATALIEPCRPILPSGTILA